MSLIDRLWNLEGRVTLVTGAAGGLGSRFAEVLYAAGADVWLASRNTEALEALATRLGDRASVFTYDGSDHDSILTMVAAVRARSGRIDVLVNNAGITAVGPAFEDDMFDFRSVIEVDLIGAYHVSRECARAMSEAGGGSIINVASISGIVGTTGVPMASYVAAKGGMIALTRDLSVQWGQYGIRVNALSPGWIAAGMGTKMDETERGRAWVARRTALGRSGRVEELDGAVLFLASDASTFVTGHNLVVDGGWTAM